MKKIIFPAVLVALICSGCATIPPLKVLSDGTHITDMKPYHHPTPRGYWAVVYAHAIKKYYPNWGDGEYARVSLGDTGIPYEVCLLKAGKVDVRLDSDGSYISQTDLRPYLEQCIKVMRI